VCGVRRAAVHPAGHIDRGRTAASGERPARPGGNVDHGREAKAAGHPGSRGAAAAHASTHAAALTPADSRTRGNTSGASFDGRSRVGERVLPQRRAMC
jgi:hypothetical protein